MPLKGFGFQNRFEAGDRVIGEEFESWCLVRCEGLSALVPGPHQLAREARIMRSKAFRGEIEPISPGSSKIGHAKADTVHPPFGLREEGRTERILKGSGFVIGKDHHCCQGTGRVSEAVICEKIRDLVLAEYPSDVKQGPVGCVAVSHGLHVIALGAIAGVKHMVTPATHILQQVSAVGMLGKGEGETGHAIQEEGTHIVGIKVICRF